ncbi:MAG: type I-E CRISPR-associated protein Cse2/CasB [Abitibacteriaceae bacterium]|nr:type I-E CRISPR-associated protein Cse2/CasB [Abditibacteriaceae bacterium]
MNEATVAAVAPQPATAVIEDAAGESRASDKSQQFPKHDTLKIKDWWEALAQARQFVWKLEDLRDPKVASLRGINRGKLAALRRNAGATTGTSRGVAWVADWLHEVPVGQHEQFFLIATLFDLNRKPPIMRDFGETMRRVKENASDSFERRFLVLLDAQFDLIYDALDGTRSGGGELTYRLDQMVKLAASKEVGVNWPVLLADLCCWELPGKPVQKKWARNFYAPRLAPDDDLSAVSLLSSDPA